MDSLAFDSLIAALQQGRGAGVGVAILDSGVECNHPALEGFSLSDDLAYTVGENGLIQSGPGEGLDVYGHGTAIASVIRRVAPEARIGSFRVLNANLGAKVALISAAVEDAIRLRYNILNCSFGCADAYGRHLPTFKEWIDQAYLGGIHVVAACNNHNFEAVEWPGHFPTVLTCNMGRHKTDDVYYLRRNLVEFVARGVDEHLPWNGGAFKVVSGSSYAAPIVSGLVARLLSRVPDADPLLVKSVLRRHAKPWEDSVAGPNMAAAFR